MRTMKKKDPTSHRIIEKRRRDRMNNCLADLSKLIPAHYMKKGRGRIEKTEIIEMAIKHLKDLIGQTSSSSSSSSSAASATAAAAAATTTSSSSSSSSSSAAAAAAAAASASSLLTSSMQQHSKMNSANNISIHIDGAQSEQAGRVGGESVQMCLETKGTASSSSSSPSSSLSSTSTSTSSSLSLSLSTPGEGRTSNHEGSTAAMVICTDDSHQTAAMKTTTALPIGSQMSGFIKDQDFQYLETVNKTLTKMETGSSATPASCSSRPLALAPKVGSGVGPSAPATSSKSYHNHYHNGHNHHHHHHHHHHGSGGSGTGLSSMSGASSSLNTPSISSNNDASSSSSGAEDAPIQSQTIAHSATAVAASATATAPATAPATATATAAPSMYSHQHQHQHHHHHKYRSSPNSSGSDSSSSGGSSSSSSGNMSGSSSGHRAGSSSCSMRTSCSSSSVASMNQTNLSRPIGLVVDRGTTTSLQAAMAAASVTVSEPVGGDTSAGSSSSSLNTISGDSMVASPQRPLASSGVVTSGDQMECCTCGSRILQTLKQHKTNNCNGSSSDSSLSSSGAASDELSSSIKSPADSIDYYVKTMSSNQLTLGSNKRNASNADDHNKCNSITANPTKLNACRMSSSSTGLLSLTHSDGSSPSSSSISLLSPTPSSSASTAWYKKAWLVRSFSRSPPPR